MTQFTKYVKATMAEMRQVSWPSRREATTYSVLVIAISAVVAMYVGVADFFFSQGISMIINRF